MMKSIVVIKLGGSSLGNPETLSELATLVKGYQNQDFHVVLVHGGGPAINQELERRGITWKFIDGQRQTTLEMMAVINQVLAHEVNSHLVSTLRQNDIESVGLSGAQHHILMCRQANPELMQVGQVETVNTEAILKCLQNFESMIPVIAPIGIGSEEELYNVNADWAATKIAIALQADKLIFLTDQNGILDQEKKLVSQANPSVLQAMIDEGSISGGMSTKVRAMIAALNAGLKQVRVLHAGQAGKLLQMPKLGTLITEAVHGRAV